MTPPSRHEWWQTAVVYQIYPRSYRDTTGSGIGDLQGILESVPYLSETLGVDAIWISPFYPSPMADFGYDVSDYRAVHPMFGDLATFDRLVEAIHAAGLKLIVDFVPSHTSDRHAWFLESRSSRDNPRRDWYVWRDPKPDGSPPNNWLSVFGGSAWELDETTGQYYRHTFLVEQPDVDWRNPELRAAQLDNMRFWLDRGADGFRVDAPLFAMKDPDERDNPPNEGGSGILHKPLGAYDAQIHLHDVNHPDIHGVFRDMRAVLDDYDPPRMALAEMHEFDPEALATFYGADLDELHMPANFGLMKPGWDATEIRQVVDALERAVPAGAWLNWVLGSHDDKRLATRLGEPASRQAAVLLLTLRGSPTLYYGDEIGMREASIPPERQQDPWGRAEPELGRDGCRTPMQWTADRHAGFSEAAETWLPVSDDYATRNVAAQLDDPDSQLSLYRRLLRLRKGSAALRTGAYRSFDAGDPDIFAYERVEGADRAVVAINISKRTAALAAPELTGRVAASTDRAGEGREADGSLALGPWEAVVLTG